MTRIIFTTTGALALLMAGPATAFGPLPDGTTTEERANTARLNAEQAARAQAEIAAYQQNLAAVAQQTVTADASYSEQTAAYEAEKARIAVVSNEDRMKWEADVAACKGGDASRCAPPSP